MFQEKLIVWFYDLVKFHKQKKSKDINKEYYNILKQIHRKLSPKKYIEIGVRKGHSIVMAKGNTICYGVDPEPIIEVNLNKNTHIFSLTSDNFFKDYEKYNINNDKVDLAFIDGMHLFDFVLRDFINIEKLCTKKSVILLHDTVPNSKETSTRERNTQSWTGDVWKIILVLKKYRPDLEIFNSDAEPSGLAIVKNLDPDSTVLSDNYEKIVDEFMNYDYDKISENKEEILAVKNCKNYKEFIRK